jgi:asparagine synthase (glutamine-hydrolysing)
MCGLVGYVGSPIPRPQLEAARDLLRHRGPDADGVWESHDEGVSAGLAFRRLRILDLTQAADQPMSRDGLHLVYNGEIYNFRELREQLEGKGHRFQSTGDTEVLLAAYREWGLDAISRLEGMFAFAIWDEPRKRMVLGRDRLGIKPLYYARTAERVSFASEAKAVLALADIPAKLNEPALGRFLTFLWVPDPDTLFEGVRKLPPGHFAVFEDGAERIEQYWDVEFRGEPGSLDEHAERLRESVRAAVSRQLVSDVSLGVFLSGGVDSTLIARLAAEESQRPVLAIATGFAQRLQANEVGEDDLPFARLAARAIPNLDYREIVLSELSADVAAELTDNMDDPVADPAAISTYLICRAAKPDATVMLSGVGSEELFAGYPRHRAVPVATRMARLPAGLRRGLFRRAAALVPGALPGSGMGGLRHTKKLLQGLSDPEPYIGFCAHHDAASLARLVGAPVDWSDVTEVHRRHLARAARLPPLSRALYLDMKTFLPSLNLAYTDRSSMACSVEVRIPLLDELVVQRALAIPDEMKVSRGTGKYVLKRAAEGLVPDRILTRPKTGFGAPVRTWMREFAGDVIRDCLSAESLRSRGWLSTQGVREMRTQLLRGQSDQALQLWAVVILELWARRFLDQPVSVPVG